MERKDYFIRAEVRDENRQLISTQRGAKVTALKLEVAHV